MCKIFKTRLFEYFMKGKINKKIMGLKKKVEGCENWFVDGRNKVGIEIYVMIYLLTHSFTHSITTNSLLTQQTQTYINPPLSNKPYLPTQQSTTNIRLGSKQSLNCSDRSTRLFHRRCYSSLPLHLFISLSQNLFFPPSDMTRKV